MKIYLIKKQKGQAMVETAITLPLLVFLLIGIGYFGSVITAMHNLSVAARYSARAVAMDSTKMVIDRTEGGYFLRLTEKTFKEFAIKSLPGFSVERLSAKPLTLEQVAFLTSSISRGRLQPIPESKGYAFVYKLTGRADAISTTLSNNVVPQLRGFDVGIGNIFYGVRLNYDLKELNWLSGYLFKRNGIKIEAISVMPAELPLRSIRDLGMDYGLMNINDGLFKIIRVNVRNNNDAKRYGYEDLVK
jgi:hypothetical protein